MKTDNFDVRGYTLLFYIPKRATYHVLQHNILIKTENGWEEGCSYVEVFTEGDNKQVYVRPYSNFPSDKWSYGVVGG